MKLEKFDYQIGDKKTKKQFVILGVLCIALIVTVVLYKTFAAFSSKASYNIVSGRVASFGDNRTEVIRVDISKTTNDEVYAILYDDNTLSIDGDGYMKDFEGVDLIGEVLDAYIADPDNVTFTAEEQAFINDHQQVMGTLFDYAGRSFLVRDDNPLNTYISNSFKDQENNPIQADIDMATSLMTKVSNAGFSIEQIEVINDVKNIGKNAFSLPNATATSTIRDNVYTNLYISKDYKCNLNAGQGFNLFTLDANLEEVGENAGLDLYLENIEIGENVTTIPDDLFANFNGTTGNGGNAIFCVNAGDPAHEKKNNVTITIPDGVTKIGINAFYYYNGADLSLPSGLTEIDEYAFANYYGNDITIPSTVTTIKTGAFRDFTGKITMSACPASNDFAPNAQIYGGQTLCSFN